jgi:Ras-related protein Rab-1A
MDHVMILILTPSIEANRDVYSFFFESFSFPLQIS